MAKIPVVCDSCDLFFMSRSLLVGAGQVTFINCFQNQCPKCGNPLRILDGTYELVDNTTKLLSGPESTVSKLKRLYEILQTAKTQKSTANEIKNQLNKEIPSLSALSDLLPKTKQELYTAISIIIAVISLLMQSMNKSPSTKIEVNQVVNNIFQETPLIPKVKPNKNPSINNYSIPKKTGRNAPCTCGSGRKYKHCHGKVNWICFRNYKLFYEIYYKK